MNGQKLRRHLAAQAFELSSNKMAVEKTIYVDENTFKDCLDDKNKHHKTCIYNKGYLRTYHEPFYIDHENEGQSYCHGIVHIVNKDAQINQVYVLDSARCEGSFESALSEALKIKKHRLIEVVSDSESGLYAILTPQRIDFEEN